MAAVASVSCLAAHAGAAVDTAFPRIIGQHGPVHTQHASHDITPQFTPATPPGGRSDGYYWAPFDVPTSYGFLTEIAGMNNSGSLVGTYYGDSGESIDGFTFSSDLFRPVMLGSSGVTYLNGINDAGTYVGYWLYDHGDVAGYVGFSKSPSGKINQLPPPSPDTVDIYADGISNDGDISGSTDTSEFVLHGFIYRDGKYVVMYDYPGSTGTVLDGVNDVGQAVGYAYRQNGNLLSFLLDLKTGKRREIAYPGAVETAVETINDAGQVCGFYGVPSGNQFTPLVLHGFIYDHGKYTTHDFPGAAGTIITDVTNSGKLTGQFSLYESDVSASIDSFVATPAPE